MRCLAAALLLAVSAGATGGLSARADPPGADKLPVVPPVAPADALRVEQQRIADNYQQLQGVLLRMAELSEVTDPRRAALLRKAIQQSQERLIGVQFESLVELLGKDQLSRAIENQDTLQKDLQALLELLLSENRARRVESEKARIREYLKRLTQLIRQQKGIQGRTAGNGQPGPLADEQQDLAGKTRDLADDVKRNEEPAASPSESPGAKAKPAETPPPSPGEKKSEGEPQPKEPSEGQSPAQSQQGGKPEEKEKPNEQAPSPSQGEQPGGEQPQGQGQGEGRPQPQPKDQEQNPARRRIEAAEQRMREASEKLREAQREGAVEKQEEAIQELEEAKAELERILRQLREEEIERMLTTLEARFKKMLDAEREVYDGTLRLDKVPSSERTQSHQIEASRLSRKQAEIVLEADKAMTLLHDDGTAVAVPEALEQIREDMRQVVRRLDRAEVGALTQTIEEEIVTSLEEMIDAFQKAQQEAKDKKQAPMPPGPPQDQPLVDMLAEIKMIRAMQMRVNRRTERYSKLIEGEQAGNPELLQALDELAERQARIHQITRDLEMGKNR